MFAHQIIEDFKKMEDGKDKNFSHWIKTCRTLLEKAHCFHLGEIQEIHEAFLNREGRELFRDNTKFIKLPYRLSFFDGIASNQKNIIDGFVRASKEGILALNLSKALPDILLCFVFSFYDGIRMWGLQPVAFLICVGGDFTEEIYEKLAADPLNILGGKSPVGLQGKGNIRPIKLFGHLNEEGDKVVISCHLNLQMLQEAILLLNCKNIEMVNHEPPPRLNRIRRKNGKQEIFTYKTLQIVSPKKEQKSEENKPALSHNRIHFCRGHFKEYTTENPLLGKFTGLYWWQAQVRGKNKEGIILKDYELNTKT